PPLPFPTRRSSDLGATRRLRLGDVRRQPGALAVAAQQRSLPERRRVARRAGGAGLDPQPQRARLAGGADQRAGPAGLLSLRADRPAAAHRDWHHGLVAAEVPVSFRKILALLVLVAALGTYL